MRLPAEMTERKQWTFWRYELREGSEKSTKVPCQATGHRASSTDPRHWSSFDYVVNVWGERPEFADGIGFVFTPEDPFCGIDLDNCYPSDAAEIASWASGIRARFADTYNEQSPSETGLKIFCKARAPRCGRWDVTQTGRIEIYDRSRFFAVTGKADNSIPRTLVDHQANVEQLVEHLDEGRSQVPTTINGTIAVGRRHNTLLSLAGSLWRRGVEAHAIETLLLEVNARQCDPPRSQQHIRKIVRSMERWPR